MLSFTPRKAVKLALKNKFVAFIQDACDLPQQL